MVNTMGESARQQHSLTFRKQGWHGCSRSNLSCPNNARNGPAASVTSRADASPRRSSTNVAVRVGEGVAEQVTAKRDESIQRSTRHS
jgi:hypothetical protein